MNYPSNIKSLKAKLAYWFFKNWYTLMMGRGALIGRWTTLFTDFAVIILVIDKYYKVSLPMIVFLFILSNVVAWIGGYFYMKKELDKIEAQVNNERNPIANEVHKAVVKETEREKL